MKRIMLIGFLFTNSQSFSQVNLNLGLRAYYPFTGNAKDASGNNNNPAFNNATLTSDQYGNPNSAYHFNGINNYMMIPNSPSLNTGKSISICAKIKPTGFYTGRCQNSMLLSKGDDDFLPGTFNLRFADPVLGCTEDPPTTKEVFYGGGAVARSPYIYLNQWYNVVCTYDGTTAKIYVDCKLRATNTVSQSTFQSFYNLYIGHLNNRQYPYWLNGDLDEIRIYDRALNQDEVNAYSECASSGPCSNWLHTAKIGESVKIGDLDIKGNQITIEAFINRTAQYTGNYIYGGDIVSKHSTPDDVNYLLRPNDAEITTTNGFFNTAPICEIELNKTYHVAMTYDGSTLKFYRNGFLMSQVSASGNLIQNNAITTIGDWANYTKTVHTNFIGYINEVRIWNVARTQEQIKTYMNTYLPNPPAQKGLLAYYTFDQLINKQGNAAWNGSLHGAAAIQSTNPNCKFIRDSCNNKPPQMSLVFSDPSVVKNKLIRLKWNTEAETNVDKYTIKRSSTGKSKGFITIGNVYSNKKTTSNKYSFSDSTAEPNVLYYYKLEIHNSDRNKSYSETKKTKIISKVLALSDLPDINDRNYLEAGRVNLNDTFTAERYNAKADTLIPEKNADIPVDAPMAAVNVTKRKNDIQETIYFTSDSLEISLFDNGQIDGDTVSVLMNGNIIIAKQLLKATAFRKMIAMPQDADSIQLIMYAENLGTIPPNTGLLVVKDGKDIHEIRFSGDTQKNATIILRRKGKL